MENTDKQQFHLKRIDPQVKSSIIRSSGIFMKLNRNVVISVIIVLITVVIGGYLFITKKDSLIKKGNSTDIINTVGLKFSDKNFNLKFADINPETLLVISDFEREDEWQGQHEYDDGNFWEGEYSLILSSRDNELIDVYIEKNINLDKYTVFKLALNVQSDPSDIEAARLYFANKDKSSSYYYSIRNLVKGWNFLTISKLKFSAQNVSKTENSASPAAKTAGSSWENIERVGFELASRANSNTDVNIDSLKAFQDEEYLSDWLVNNPLQLDLTKSGDKYYLLARNYAGTVALIKKLICITNFKFKAKLMPIRNNTRSGFFVRGDFKTGYGYYFMIHGINGNRYQILKMALKDEKTETTILKNGAINNFIVEKNVPLWLKVEAKGANFKFFLSTDDKSYSRSE